MPVAYPCQDTVSDTHGVLSKLPYAFRDSIKHQIDTRMEALLVQEFEDHLGQLLGLVVADVVDGLGNPVGPAVG